MTSTKNRLQIGPNIIELKNKQQLYKINRIKILDYKFG